MNNEPPPSVFWRVTPEEWDQIEAIIDNQDPPNENLVNLFRARKERRQASNLAPQRIKPNNLTGQKLFSTLF